MRVALAQAVAAGVVLGERLAARVDRVLHRRGQVALVRAPLEQRGALLARQAVREAQRAGELCRRLAVRAERRRALAGRRREPQHRVAVAGRLGVVGEPREVDLPPGRAGERGQRAPVEREPRGPAAAPPRSATRAISCRNATASRSRAQHPGGEALLEMAELAAGQRLQQPELGARRRDRHRVEQRAGRPAPSRAARASTASRTLSGTRGAARRERLGDEERVAGRPAVELVRVDAVRPRQRGDRASARAARARAGVSAAGGSSPSATRSAWSRSSSSSR